MSSPTFVPPFTPPKRKSPASFDMDDVIITHTFKKRRIPTEAVLADAKRRYTEICTSLGAEGLTDSLALAESGFVDVDLLGGHPEQYLNLEDAQQAMANMYTKPVIPEIKPSFWIEKIEELFQETADLHDIDALNIEDETQKLYSPREGSDVPYNADPATQDVGGIIEEFLEEMDMYLKNLFVQSNDYWSLKITDEEIASLKDWRNRFRYLPAWGREYYGDFRNYCNF